MAEAMRGFTEIKRRIDSLTGTAKCRYPDEINDVARAIREVENVKYLGHQDK